MKNKTIFKFFIVVLALYGVQAQAMLLRNLKSRLSKTSSTQKITSRPISTSPIGDSFAEDCFGGMVGGTIGTLAGGMGGLIGGAVLSVPAALGGGNRLASNILNGSAILGAGFGGLGMAKVMGGKRGAIVWIATVATIAGLGSLERS